MISRAGRHDDRPLAVRGGGGWLPAGNVCGGGDGWDDPQDMARSAGRGGAGGQRAGCRYAPSRSRRLSPLRHRASRYFDTRGSLHGWRPGRGRQSVGCRGQGRRLHRAGGVHARAPCPSVRRRPDEPPRARPRRGPAGCRKPGWRRRALPEACTGAHAAAPDARLRRGMSALITQLKT